MIRNEGVFSLYKGLSSPLYSLPLVNAIVFGVYSFTKSMLEGQNKKEFVRKKNKFQIIMYSSLVAGLANSFVIGPIELFKIKL